MKLNIITRGIELTPALEEHVERQVAAALIGLETSITWVVVRLERSPEQPALCGLELGLQPRGRLSFEKVGEDLLGSLDELVTRANLAVGPLIENIQSTQIPRLQRPVASPM